MPRHSFNNLDVGYFLVPTAASIPTRFFSGRTDARQNRMEVHRETQTIASLPKTLEEFKLAKISFSINSMTLVMIYFFFKLEQRMRFVVCVEIIQRIRHCNKMDGFASFVVRFVSFVACRTILRKITAIRTGGI